ncbi:cupin domain-containing protein [Thalassoglobus sp. JC818]|uniref:cupin domain-containing protein n=1 Tax=Thalassoglobus sp. JC818 TaxID=3232136 RepID=UPI00345A57DC
MPRLIESPTVVQAAGNKPKLIEEFIGRVNSGDDSISIARMKSPEGWVEPGQTPHFREMTIVLSGELHIESKTETLKVQSGQAVICEPGEWVRYSTPGKEGAEYLAICLPAFSPESVHRDE